MVITIIEQQDLLLQISKKLPRQITAYAIGGTAMIFYGLKETTLDIDLVFTNQKDRETFKETVKSMGYNDMDPIIVYGRKPNTPDMIKLYNSRIDLFLNQVINFTFSEDMQKRAKETHQFGKNLILKTADIHDLIIMKCATNREKDEKDIISIMKNSKVNWEILVNEAQNQINLGNEQAILSLGTLLEKLKNLDIQVPTKVLDQLWELLKNQIEKKKSKSK